MITEHICDGCVKCPLAHDSTVYTDAQYCIVAGEKISKKYLMKSGIAPKWCPLPLELKQEGKRK